MFFIAFNFVVCGIEIYSLMIEVCVKCGELGEVYYFYKECIDKGIDVSFIVISVFVNNLINYGRVLIYF